MYIRKKHGRGFTYQTEEGKTIKDAKLKAWFEELVIPPAWSEVEISESKSSKVLVTGRDEKGRKQYIYNPSYRKKQEQKKFNRIINFAEQLETMRRVTGQHLRDKKMSRTKVLATMVRLMDQAYFRPGSKRYSQNNGSYGLTTIRSKHIEVQEGAIQFSYVGKSGKEQDKLVEDPKLAKIVQQLDEMPGYRVFKYIDEEGEKTEVNSSDLNDYIQEIMGDEFSAKDFRTWAGTLAAAIALEELGAVEKKDQKKLDKNVRDAVVTVSEILGNTPAVARQSYIDPRIIQAYLDGQTVSYFAKEAEQLLNNSKHLDKEEHMVLCMLKNRG